MYYDARCGHVFVVKSYCIGRIMGLNKDARITFEFLTVATEVFCLLECAGAAC
jgi:hypothetical protein